MKRKSTPTVAGKERMNVEIIGLDKIRKISDNTELEPAVTGLEYIHPDDDSVNITGLDRIRHIVESDLPKMSPFAVELIRLVDRARELDAEYRQFGAATHRYEFNSVVPLSAVRDFEKRHSIRLPQGYVDFLTQVGNGGAGPDYGIYSLEQAEREGYYDHKNAFCHYMKVSGEADYATLPFSLADRPPLVNRSLTPAQWEEWYTTLNGLDESGYDEMYPQAYNGLLQIIDSGCCSGYMLVCHGDMTGEMVFFRHELEYPQPTGQTFEDFVLSHFKSVVSQLERQRSST